LYTSHDKGVVCGENYLTIIQDENLPYGRTSETEEACRWLHRAAFDTLGSNQTFATMTTKVGSGLRVPTFPTTTQKPKTTNAHQKAGVQRRTKRTYTRSDHVQNGQNRLFSDAGPDV
jgi:hypothetical protein